MSVAFNRHSRYRLDSSVFEDLRTPVNQVRVPGSKAPTWTAYSAGQVLGFSDQAVEGNEEEVYFAMQIPHNYKQGTNLGVHLHWTPSSADTAVVRWGLEYEIQNEGGTFSSTTTAHANHSISGDNDNHLVTNIVSVSGSGVEMSAVLICRLFRNSSNAADTFDDSALLFEADLHYEIDAPGSFEHHHKFTTSTSSSSSTTTSSTTTSSSSTTTAP